MDFLIYTVDSQDLKAICHAQDAQDASDWSSDELNIPADRLEIIPARDVNVQRMAKEANVPLINF